MKARQEGTMKTMLFLIMGAFVLMGVMMMGAVTAKAADSPYYMSAPSDKYSLTVSGDTLTLSDKENSSIRTSFKFGYTDYTNVSAGVGIVPYSDLKVTEEDGFYKVFLPELEMGEYSYPDYCIEFTSLSKYTGFSLTNTTDDDDGFIQFSVSITDETLELYKKDGMQARQEIFRDNLTPEFPVLELSMIPTGDPKDYTSVLFFDDTSGWGVWDESRYGYDYMLYGEPYGIYVVSSEDMKNTLSKTEYFETRLLVNTNDMSSYAIELSEGDSVEDVCVVIDGKKYYFDENKRVSLAQLGDSKMHTITLEAVYPDITECRLDFEWDNHYYTGKAHKPELTVYAQDGVTVLKEGTDYTVKYSNNKNIGFGEITVTGKGEYKGIVHSGFEIMPPKEGESFTVSGYKYKVTDSWGYSVSAVGATKKTVTSVSVPATVKIGGKKFKVTGIEDNAFAGYSKLKTVTIGKNVTAIGKKAFNGDSKIKTITVNSKNISKVGAKAFTGIKTTAKVTVPSAKVKAYTNLFVKAGLNKKVKVTK